MFKIEIFFADTIEKLPELKNGSEAMQFKNIGKTVGKYIDEALEQHRLQEKLRDSGVLASSGEESLMARGRPAHTDVNHVCSQRLDDFGGDCDTSLHVASLDF